LFQHQRSFFSIRRLYKGQPFSGESMFQPNVQTIDIRATNITYHEADAGRDSESKASANRQNEAP
jgi:hypothetical protein